MIERGVEEVNGKGGKDWSWVETHAQQTDGVTEGEKEWAESISLRWSVWDCVSVPLTPPCPGPDPALSLLVQRRQPSVTPGPKVQLILVFESRYFCPEWPTHQCLHPYTHNLCGRVLLQPTINLKWKSPIFQWYQVMLCCGILGNISLMMHKSFWWIHSCLIVMVHWSPFI